MDEGCISYETELVEEQKIGTVFEKKRLERLEMKRKAEQMWLRSVIFQ